MALSMRRARRTDSHFDSIFADVGAASMESFRDMSPQRIVEFFRALDTDGDGIISAEEVRLGLKSGLLSRLRSDQSTESEPNTCPRIPRRRTRFEEDAVEIEPSESYQVTDPVGTSSSMLHSPSDFDIHLMQAKERFNLKGCLVFGL